ncbi:MAG: acylphosphatase, partial [Methanosarcinales archaeon]
MSKKIIIKGKVHDVGYRPFLLGKAEAFELERFFADNVFLNGKPAVEILIDAEESKIANFIEILEKVVPERAKVEEIKVEDYEGYVMKIESYYRYLTAMQLFKIATYGGKMLEKQDKTIEILESVKDDTSAIKEKQDAMLEKQDKTIEILESVKDDTSAIKEKQDAMLEKQDKTIEILESVKDD